MTRRRTRRTHLARSMIFSMYLTISRQAVGRQHVQVGHVFVELLPVARQGGEDGVVRDGAAGVKSCLLPSIPERPDDPAIAGGCSWVAKPNVLMSVRMVLSVCFLCR